jgi:hypothetical protein
MAQNGYFPRARGKSGRYARRGMTEGERGKTMIKEENKLKNDMLS